MSPPKPAPRSSVVPAPETRSTGTPGGLAVTFTVEGDPIPQPRPRVYRNGGVGEDPRATRHKQATIMAARRARLPLLSGEVELVVAYYRATTRRCDWDNLAKLTCDALTGIAWQDDSQIVSVQVLKCVDRKRPRTEVAIRAWPPIVVPVADWHDAWDTTAGTG